MRRVATQLEDAGVVIKHIAARLADVAALDGRHKPDESLRELKDAIAYTNHLQAILDNLRERFVEAVVASQSKGTTITQFANANQNPQPKRTSLEIVK